jgi:Zn finger protein HypA/HybF involved in hydrogenase expression
VVASLDPKTGIKFHEKLRHGDCRRCHTISNPEEDRRTCKDCHKGWVVDTKEKRPPLEQAIHMRCMECHDKTYAEVTDKMPVRCDDCHKPDPSVLANLEIGLILWNHDRHSQYGKGMTCNKCHHTDQPDQPHMACSRCHGTGLYKNPPVVEALRRRCLGCHQEKQNGLISFEQLDTDRKQVNLYRYEGEEGSFWWDHRAHAIAYSFSCRDCHHGLLRKDGKYVMGVETHKDWSGKATHVQTCRNCHGEAGPVAGSPAAGTKAPKLDDAFKKVCLECHTRLKGGPQTWDAYFKVEPIEPVAGGPTDPAPTEKL